MANERICCVCGTEYKYCSNCSEFSHLEPWHFMFDKKECMKIFDICTNFVNTGLSANDAKKRLDKIKLPSKFTKAFQKDIDKIYSEATSSKEEVIVPETKQEEQQMGLESNISAKIEEIAETTIEEEKPRKRFRNRFAKREADPSDSNENVNED